MGKTPLFSRSTRLGIPRFKSVNMYCGSAALCNTHTDELFSWSCLKLLLLKRSAKRFTNAACDKVMKIFNVQTLFTRSVHEHEHTTDDENNHPKQEKGT
jgi:hypothetical protein